MFDCFDSSCWYQACLININNVFESLNYSACVKHDYSIWHRLIEIFYNYLDILEWHYFVHFKIWNQTILNKNFKISFFALVALKTKNFSIKSHFAIKSPNLTQVRFNQGHEHLSLVLRLTNCVMNLQILVQQVTYKSGDHWRDSLLYK